MNGIAVVTASRPDRTDMLAELVAAVEAQTVSAAEHIIEIDYGYTGCIETTNRAAARVTSPWMLIMNDDDLIDPDCIEVYTDNLVADVVYAYTRVTGRADDWCPNRPFDAARLRAGNYICAGSVIRTDVWRAHGGYRESPTFCDYDLWLRILDAGGTFHCVPQVIWTYRYGPWEQMSG